jgi:hypothetical protein
VITCTDQAKVDGVVYTCAREDGHPGMHISEEQAVWSPGMGIPTPPAKPERNLSPEAQRVSDVLGMVGRTLNGTPAENLARREADHKVFTDRHAYMLEVITDPILREMVVAHQPQGGWDATCAECEPYFDDYGEQPASWPCQVWMFVSDRL